jgi:hypothetical protein
VPRELLCARPGLARGEKLLDDLVPALEKLIRRDRQPKRAQHELGRAPRASADDLAAVRARKLVAKLGDDR